MLLLQSLAESLLDPRSTFIPKSKNPVDNPIVSDAEESNDLLVTQSVETSTISSVVAFVLLSATFITLPSVRNYPLIQFR